MQGEGQSWAWQPSSVPLLVESKRSPYDPVTEHHRYVRSWASWMGVTCSTALTSMYGTGHNHVNAISTIEFESFVNDR
jgi:hypothetical protein